ncbi:MAG: hypothetical protein ACYSUD_12470 [Planctomycetota bacterium]|jgi:hypothetical protein
MFLRMKWFVAVLLILGMCTGTTLAELIGYWSFDEGQGTATSDVTGNGNDGTLSSGVDWMPGYKGSGVRFDTAGERVVVGPIDPTAENNAMTLAAWINWENVKAGIPAPVSSGSGRPNQAVLSCFEPIGPTEGARVCGGITRTFCPMRMSGLTWP